MTHDQLELLIRTHQAMVYRYLRYMGAAADVADDVAQETFLASYKSTSIPLEDAAVEGGRCAAWLRGVARNQLLMYFRKARSNPISSDPAMLEQALQEADEVWATELLRNGDGFDYVEALQGCLAKLQGTQRKVLDMFYGEEFSRAQIAESLNMSEDGIKSLLRRVRAALKQCVELRLGGKSRGQSGGIEDFADGMGPALAGGGRRMIRDNQDALIDQLLREILGGDRPRDLTVRVLAHAKIYDRTRRRWWAGVGSAVAAAVAISVSIWMFWPQAYPASHLVEGDLEVLGGSGNGEEIQRGSQVQTDATAHASVAIGGYVLVAMDPDTQMTMGGSKYAEKVFLEHGAMDVDVTKKTGTFDVAVGSANVHVTGTKFHLAMRPEQVEGGIERNLIVHVKEGSVQVSGIKDQNGNELPATTVEPGTPQIFPITFVPRTIKRVPPPTPAAVSKPPVTRPTTTRPSGTNETGTANNRGTARGPLANDMPSRPLQVVIDTGILEQNGILRRTKTNAYFLQNDARGPMLIFAQQPPFDSLPPLGSYVHVVWNDGRCTKVELLATPPTSTTQAH